MILNTRLEFLEGCTVVYVTVVRYLYIIMSRRMEEAISRLTLALEELDENRRAEELQKSVGANWIKIARAMDRFCSA